MIWTILVLSVVTLFLYLMNIDTARWEYLLILPTLGVLIALPHTVKSWVQVFRAVKQLKAEQKKKGELAK